MKVSKSTQALLYSMGLRFIMGLSLIEFNEVALYLLERMRRRASHAILVDEQAKICALKAFVTARAVTPVNVGAFKQVLGRAAMAVSFFDIETNDVEAIRPKTKLYVYSLVFDTLLLAYEGGYPEVDMELLRRQYHLVSTHVIAYGTHAQKFHHYVNDLRGDEIYRQKHRKNTL